MDLSLSPAITPSTIVSAQKKLSIPIYQRLFVWGEAQIDTLLNDLWNARTSNNDYYLGVITVHENEFQQWEIVDGQQRLTFLTLLGCLLRKKIHIGKANWDGFIFSGDEGNYPRLFFHGRPEDREDILTYAKDSASDFSNPAFARFAERFSFFSHGKGDLHEFSEYCFQHAAFLVNELPKAYGPEELNLYFEKMNSTGRQLTPLEVVKGKWFSPYAARWNACMNFDKRFEKAESDIGGKRLSAEILTLQKLLDGNEPITESESTVDTAEASKCRLVMKDEVLALHVLRLCTPNAEISLNRDTLIATFNKVFSDEKAGAFIEELEKYRAWIDKNIIYLEDDGGKYDYKFRREADVKQEEEEEKEDVKCLRQFQAMLYAASGDSQQWVLEAYRTLNGGELSFDFLRHYDANSHKVDISSLCYHKIDRYWFWKLDYLLWEQCKKALGANEAYPVSTTLSNEQSTINFSEKEKNAILGYRFRRNISIEHLHPQSKGDKEGYPGWGSRENPDAAMHRFGNLAMISVDANSAQSNDGIGTKFGRVRDWLSAGRLESIKMFFMFSLCGGDENKWDIPTMETHEKDMLNLLIEDHKRWQEYPIH